MNIATRWIIFAFGLLGVVSGGARAGYACPMHDVTFHIGSNHLEVLDRSSMAKMVSCAGMVTLNVPENSSSGESLADVIRKLHQQRQDLPVLIYTWMTRWYDTPRYGSRITEDMDSVEGAFINPPYLMQRLLQYLRRARPGYYFDLTKERIRDELIERIGNSISSTGADGVFLDMTFVEPTGPALSWCRKQAACAAYSEGVRKALSMLKQRVGKKLLIINGVFTGTTLDLHAQESLLEHVDGAMIEYFGLNPNAAEKKRPGHPQGFENGILAYWKLVERHPDKWFLLYGRAPGVQLPRDLHDKWGQYLYVAYLMVARRNTLFKYHASFQVPPHKGNSGGLDMLELRDRVNLGQPIARRQQNGDVWWRPFEKGVVLLCPHDKQRPCDTRTLKSGLLDCSIPSTLRPGEARIVSSCRHRSPGDVDES